MSITDGLTLSRDELESWAGRRLTDNEIQRLDKAIRHSSIPDAISAIVGEWDPDTDDHVNLELPPIYRTLAATALREHRQYGPESHVNLPDDLPFLPRGAERDEDGDLYVTAAELLRRLQLSHLIDDETTT